MSEKIKLRLTPPDNAVEPPLLVDLLAEAGYELRSDCGGRGVCGKCLVEVRPAEAVSPPASSKALPAAMVRAGLRLACQSRVLAPLQVAIPSESLATREANGKTALNGEFSVAPMVERVALRLERGHQGASSQGEALAQALGADAPLPRNLATARQLAQALGQGGEITLALHREQGLTAAYQGRHPRSLGLALDLGTTTLAAYLVDCGDGSLLAAANSANPQRRMGDDVISRITYTLKHQDGLERLAGLVRREVDALASVCLGRAGARPEEIDEVLLVGNTTMQQMFCGLDPSGLAKVPYLPFTRRAQDYSAADLGLSLGPGVNVHIFPVASGFVGGDTLAAALADGMHQRPETTLLVDIGTNGELVLAHQGRLWATSCATGPALEGAHLSAGMRAVTGAIDHFSLDPRDQTLQYQVIGAADGALPRGICGSGVIDLVANLLRAGVLREDGRLRGEAPKVTVDERGVGRAFTVVPAGNTAQGSGILLTLNDMRQIQLAKAALAAGIKLLLAQAGIGQVDRLVLTGAFGAHFDWRNAMAIGMLPVRALRVESVINAAGKGAVAALVNREKRREAAALVQGIQVLDLARHPDFSLTFAEEIRFPPYP